MAKDELDENIRDSHNVWRELHERIGSLVTAFAGLEIELINSLGLLINDGDLDIGAIVAGKLSFAGTVDLFEELGLRSLASPEPRDDLGGLVKRLRRLGTLRNQIVHSAWWQTVRTSDGFVGEGPFTLEKVRQRARHGPSGSVLLDPFALLDEAQALVGVLFDELQSFTTEYLC